MCPERLESEVIDGFVIFHDEWDGQYQGFLNGIIALLANHQSVTMIIIIINDGEWEHWSSAKHQSSLANDDY